MAHTPADLAPEATEFLTERHLGSLTTLRASGLPHVVAVGFTWDAGNGIARVITSDHSQKVRNVERHGYATVFQVERARWLALEGSAVVRREAAAVREAEHRYAQRYRQPKINPQRVVIEISVSRILGSRALFVDGSTARSAVHAGDAHRRDE
ncbi:TIGR03618 family F420-dependent PPOX class oxidoreductase [Hoyosella sp. YIM 151337]|uniref:TIGR03618 family F420-dependent PPOX class oxidoreductase n=1 Tax=Hoyosella sp. YIM 151337 TaxID=2992742 RepID=UPI0022358271|nr:TIGR03618 family F420-dependent PPOX class oxidoreductase [Hoyosella sp. YIM 151337]MCW4353061.1 TIGR03618 family F420-dependent PPOX class oxidoreductase [Hoyosella sp. YIM 151337]